VKGNPRNQEVVSFVRQEDVRQVHSKFRNSAWSALHRRRLKSFAIAGEEENGGGEVGQELKNRMNEALHK
jgi:hypothetical protein